MSVRCLQGYQGLVDGGDHIRPATWESVSMMLQLVSLYFLPDARIYHMQFYGFQFNTNITFHLLKEKNRLKLMNDDTVVGH